tara:strand:- start:794 stop:1396 length:603 start_codon:yes stop_codon:yes gene_type:complete
VTMQGNISSAVRQQRHEPHKSLDDFPTPPWATRALCEFLKARGLIGPLDSVREPAPNRGHMAKVLAEYFDQVIASDVHDYGAGYPIEDYLFGPPPPRTSWTVTVWPECRGEAVVRRARSCSGSLAVLVENTCLADPAAWHDVFNTDQPAYVVQLCDELTAGGEKVAFCWLVWTRRPVDGAALHWVPPGTRRALERPGVYD